MNVGTPVPDTLSWTADPVVLFENAVMPASAHVFRLLCAYDTSTSSGDGTDPSITAISMLRSGGAEMLKARGIDHTASELSALQDAATALETFHKDHSNGTDRGILLGYAETYVIPALNSAWDAYRCVFISHVLDMQTQQAKQARAAISGLDDIRKQIFSISINASIEAARVGEAGQGFTQISREIRALSESAHTAIGVLSAISDAS